MPSSLLQYLHGFGNEFASEAVAGALPADQNAPQKAPLGLYIEELNGTAFTAPRGASRSDWTYRIRPSATHKPFRAIDSRLIRSGPFNEVPPSPNQLRWRPMAIPAEPTDFLDGVVTLGGNGDPGEQSGAAIHLYAVNTSMRDRFFYDADGELVIVPQLGALGVHTELGILEIEPGDIGLIPRGIKFRVELLDGTARGYVLENYDLYRFQCINTVTFDHPDPSIYCVLASPTAVPGTSNVELGCFPPRWSVAEHTFRPPPFHRNVASEFLGLIAGEYIGKGDGFGPGSGSLHNCMSGHGPDTDAYERGSSAELEPTYLENTLVFLFETRLPVRPTRFALETELLERDYYQHWQGLKRRFVVGEKAR